jgi:drug/metabolite transporter (DMT)-like permease
MLRLILTYGLAAGVLVAALMFISLALIPQAQSMLFGYTVMIQAFSLIFVGVKRHRDRELGGVLISLISAALLRNNHFLPATR